MQRGSPSQPGSAPLGWARPIDLHTHSTASDGTEPPADVVALGGAARASTSSPSPTTTRMPGGRRPSAAAHGHGVGLVRGVEISCSRRGVSIHLLGYLVDPDPPGCWRELEHARESRVTRLDRMVELMAADGIPVNDRAGARPGRRRAPRWAGRTSPTRSWPAASCATRDEAFADVLRNGSRYYVSPLRARPGARRRLVRAAGGVPVMAHPFANGRGWTVDDAVIEEMAAAGLGGLEAYHRDHTAAGACATPSELAARLGLFVTGSSDYHGAGKENRLGENTTAPRGPRADRGTGNQRHRRGPGAERERHHRPADLRLGLRDPARHHGPARRAADLPGAHRLADPEAEGRGRPAGLARGVRGHRAVRRVRPADPQLPAHLAARPAGRRRAAAAARRAAAADRPEQEQHADAGVNVALVPLGTPLLAGPGAIVATMLAVQGADGAGGYVAVGARAGRDDGRGVAVLPVRRPDPPGAQGQRHRAVTRIAGLLLSAIAVQMVADSVQAFVTGAA